MATKPKSQQQEHPNQSLRAFKGINTQAYRTQIGDDEFAWLENIQVIGDGNMVGVPYQGPAFKFTPAAISHPGFAYLIQSANLNGVDYMYVFTGTGSCFQVDLASHVATTIASAGTLSGSGVTMAQWENSQIVIVDPVKGYFTWDGTGLTQWAGTVQTVAITFPGTGYSVQATITPTGGGGGSFAVTADLSVNTATLALAGSGYAVGDVLTVSGGTFVSPATITVASITGGGTTGPIGGANLTDPGDYTAAPTNNVSLSGGHGTGATFTLDFGVALPTITNIGMGYTSPPTLTITGGGGTNATAVAVLSAVPPTGTAVATYAGRVWVVGGNGRTILFSAPDSFNDFTLANAGGSFVVVDEALRSTINAMHGANNFLYYMGETSIFVISDVQVVSGATVFSNTNVSDSIGTTQPASLNSYYRSIWFANPFGVYALAGTTTQKMSSPLDGIFQLLGAQLISSAACVINEILVMCFLLQYEDPVLGTRSIIACYSQNNRLWFIASQGNALTSIASSPVNGVPTLFATDGGYLYELFSDPATPTFQTIKTKLWDMGAPLYTKQSFRVGLEVYSPGSAATVINGTVDTEVLNGAFPFTLNPAIDVSWVNNANATVLWQNNFSALVDWVAFPGYAFIGTDTEAYGKYLGLTFQSSSPLELYSGIHLEYERGGAWGDS